MAGLKTDLRNLASSFEKFKAMEGEEARKRAMIQELKNAFARQGFSPWMAENLAIEKHKQIHRYQNS